MKKLLLITTLLCGCGANITGTDQADVYVGEPTEALFPAEPAKAAAPVKTVAEEKQNQVFDLPDDLDGIWIQEDWEQGWFEGMDTYILFWPEDDIWVRSDSAVSVTYQTDGITKKATKNHENNYLIPKDTEFIRIDMPKNIYIVHEWKFYMSRDATVHFWERDEQDSSSGVKR